MDDKIPQKNLKKFSTK